MLTKQAFIDKKAAVKKIGIPEWDDYAYIKKISAAERTILMRATLKVEGKNVEFDGQNLMDSIVKTVQLTLCDEAGNRLFSDSQEDFDLLNSKDADVLEHIFSEASDFNCLSADDEKEAIKN
jgi:hypothetical protein